MHKIEMAFVIAAVLACPSANAEVPASYGVVKYAIYDFAKADNSAKPNDSAKPIASGEKVLKANDFVIKKVSARQYSKGISLNGPFTFALSESGRDKVEKKGGFGLSGNRSDEKMFGWDWFNIDRPGHATKLQEKGELTFTTRKTAFGDEIDRLDFSTDVSLRVHNMKDVLPLKPQFRINILKGSWVKWPAVDAR